jgi:hypothetical protein
MDEAILGDSVLLPDTLATPHPGYHLFITAEKSHHKALYPGSFPLTLTFIDITLKVLYDAENNALHVGL